MVCRLCRTVVGGRCAVSKVFNPRSHLHNNRVDGAHCDCSVRARVAFWPIQRARALQLERMGECRVHCLRRFCFSHNFVYAKLSLCKSIGFNSFTESAAVHRDSPCRVAAERKNVQAVLAVGTCGNFRRVSDYISRVESQRTAICRWYPRDSRGTRCSLLLGRFHCTGPFRAEES